jgi:hypothetical protein
VSVLWALADEERRAEIRQAHRDAVDEVVRYYEDRAVFARAGDVIGDCSRVMGSSPPRLTIAPAGPVTRWSTRMS